MPASVNKGIVHLHALAFITAPCSLLTTAHSHAALMQRACGLVHGVSASSLTCRTALERPAGPEALQMTFSAYIQAQGSLPSDVRLACALGGLHPLLELHCGVRRCLCYAPVSWSSTVLL